MGPRTKEEPDGAEEVEGRGSAESQEAHGIGRVTIDKCKAGRTREPSEAVRRTVSDVADCLTGRDGVTGLTETGGPRAKAALVTGRPEADPRSRVE